MAYHIRRGRQSPTRLCGMLDLGLSFLGSVARDPNALAIVDGELRLTYAQWYRRISALVAGLDSLGLVPGDHIVTVLQNRWEAATLHWACQFSGVIITPVNWRPTAGELDFFLADAEAKAVVYEETSAAAIGGSRLSARLPRIALDSVSSGATSFAALTGGEAPEARLRVDAEAWSVMLYTSGTTARPKGVPRRQRAERPPLWRMSRKTFTAAASARSASCRFTTRWVSARCWQCRLSAALLFACAGSTLPKPCD